MLLKRIFSTHCLSYCFSYTPQHNTLQHTTPTQQLWALLNILLPDVFADADQFNEFFNLDTDDADAKKTMLSQLHKILRPFMLRRLKVCHMHLL
jgi:SWI/SNF-related matrix-associated actin-dependent regulator of chromatin subfamily A member 5